MPYSKDLLFVDDPDVRTIVFKKPITYIANMFNGHIRVFFDNDGKESELILLMNKKRGPVLPRRKRAEARRKGLI